MLPLKVGRSSALSSEEDGFKEKGGVQQPCTPGVKIEECVAYGECHHRIQLAELSASQGPGWQGVGYDVTTARGRDETSLLPTVDGMCLSQTAPGPGNICHVHLTTR